jgi:hypothetical protein
MYMDARGAEGGSRKYPHVAMNSHCWLSDHILAHVDHLMYILALQQPCNTAL